jgi:hypothetical protein
MMSLFLVFKTRATPVVPPSFFHLPSLSRTIFGVGVTSLPSLFKQAALIFSSYWSAIVVLVQHSVSSCVVDVVTTLSPLRVIFKSPAQLTAGANTIATNPVTTVILHLRTAHFRQAHSLACSPTIEEAGEPCLR